MIKSTNGALGIEVVREGDVICFFGHFNEKLKSEMRVRASYAKDMFNSTGTIEVQDGNRRPIGLIGHEPQGTDFFFLENKKCDLICVDSIEIKNAVRKAIEA